MKKENRLLKNQDFQKVIQAKQSIVNKSYVVYFIENGLGKIRIGISISNKFGCAVERNKAKRQTREIVSDLFPTTLSMDIVIIIRNKFGNNEFSKNKEEMNYIYKKIKEKGGQHEII